MRDQIARYCDDERIDLIVVDSVGLASDGKVSDDDTAIRFHRALNSLPPALCAAHVPKSSLSPDAKGDAVGPFGSVFFSNLCRLTWLVKKQPGASEDVVTVGLFRQKQNEGSRQRPVGLEFTFTTDRIRVRPVDLASVEGLSSRLPLGDRITHALKRGPLTYLQLAEELDAKQDSIIRAVNRAGKQFTKVEGTDNVYRIGLVDRHHVE